MNNKSWLVFAKWEKCHHAEALHDPKLGFINWREGKNFKMNVGDIVYLFVSDKRKVRFKTQVVAKGCKREDNKYWQVPPPSGDTYKLVYRDEYDGNELDEEVLKEYGFKGGGSIETPSYKNTTLIEYIESIFAKKSYASQINELILHRYQVHLLQIHNHAWCHQKNLHLFHCYTKQLTSDTDHPQSVSCFLIRNNLPK